MYKDDFGFEECSPCIIPVRGLLTNNDAKSSYMCDFNCNLEVYEEGSLVCVKTIFHYALAKGEDTLIILVIIYGFIVATYWGSIFFSKRKYKIKK